MLKTVFDTLNSVFKPASFSAEIPSTLNLPQGQNGKKFAMTTRWPGWHLGQRTSRAPSSTSCWILAPGSRYQQCQGEASSLSIVSILTLILTGKICEVTYFTSFHLMKKCCLFVYGCAGWEGLAEIWNCSTLEEVCGSHTYPVQRRLEVKRDEDQAESCGTIFHRQSEWNCYDKIQNKWEKNNNNHQHFNWWASK